MCIDFLSLAKFIDLSFYWRYLNAMKWKITEVSKLWLKAFPFSHLHRKINTSTEIITFRIKNSSSFLFCGCIFPFRTHPVLFAFSAQPNRWQIFLMKYVLYKSNGFCFWNELCLLIVYVLWRVFQVCWLINLRHFYCMKMSFFWKQFHKRLRWGGNLCCFFFNASLLNTCQLLKY